MKSKYVLFLAPIMGLALSTLGAAIAADNEADCSAAVGSLKSEIVSAKGERAKILEALEEAIKTNEACAPDLVAATIRATKADEQFVGEIVYVALGIVDDTMDKAVVDAAHGAAAEVSSSGNGGGYANGKQPVGYDKQIVESYDKVRGEDHDGRPIAISGIYLIPPVAPAAGLVGDGVLKLTDEELRRLRGGDDDDDDDDDEPSGGMTTRPPISPPNFRPDTMPN